MSDEIQTVEIKETEPVVEKAAVPSREELKSSGWTATEIEMAEKRGLIPKKEEEKKPEGKAEVKPELKEPPLESKEEKPAEKKPVSNLPDFTFKTPEQEKAFLDAFGTGTPQRAMYFRMKNERQARQAAEQDRDRIALESQLLKDRVEALEKGTPQPEVDENGNQIDPEDKPMTLKQWKEMQRQEQEEQHKKDAEIRERGGRVNEALQTQEEYAKSILPDFDDTLKLSKDLMQNLENLVPEKWRQEKALKLIRELQVAAAQADKKGLDDYNAAMIAYELGQIHPSYGKPSNGQNGAETNNDGNQDRPETKANGSLTPEQMKRIETNTQRRASSASIPGGGGRRVVSVDDISVKDVLKMSPNERADFKKKHPEKMRQLLRG